MEYGLENTRFRVGELVDELSNLLENYPNHVRPHEAARVASLAFLAADLSIEADGGEAMRREVENYAEGQGRRSGITANFVQGLPDFMKADLLLQMPLVTGPGNCDPEGPIDKRFALECAEHLGPDWAQAWYHFTVFMTKVA